MSIGFIFLLLTLAKDCNFETAFQKGAEDIEMGSFGSNIDQFCLYASDDARKNFPEFYELGRRHGPVLKKADILSTPKDQADLDKLLVDAKLSMATKEIMNRISTSPKGASLDNPEVKSLTDRIEALEAENRKLSGTIREDLTNR